jgi:hypothetical protein
MPITNASRYRRADLRSNPDWLFAFGDNLARRGHGGQAREARGEPNAVGIVTKRSPSMAPGAFLSDDDLAAVFYLWRGAFQRLNGHLLAGGTVVWPSDGIGTGLAELPTRAPALWRELQVFIAAMEAIDAAPE